jgi:hypothetical protein
LNIRVNNVRQGFLGYKETCLDIGGLVIRSALFNFRKYLIMNNLSKLEARGVEPLFPDAMSSNLRGCFITAILEAETFSWKRMDVPGCY